MERIHAQRTRTIPTISVDKEKFVNVNPAAMDLVGMSLGDRVVVYWDPDQKIVAIEPREVTQPELGLSGFGLVGKPQKKRASDLQTGFCRNLFYDLQDLIIVYAYRDGATIAELHEMFERAGCRGVYGSTISRLRDNGFDLPHRTLGTDWITHGHERLPSEGS